MQIADDRKIAAYMADVFPTPMSDAVASYWGRTRSLGTTTAYRSGVYVPNVASQRVLEKCGYEREGRLRNAVIKNGEVLDAPAGSNKRAQP